MWINSKKQYWLLTQSKLIAFLIKSLLQYTKIAVTKININYLTSTHLMHY